ncbi:UDP-glucose/GDP-mannose dehydrogenase family protein [Amycolatopsis rubida]|uniref:UDP-glucose 6-dehydrogenase n=1 Tax=Amycolatopsis rubida TaxID=112413 RepID=A0ABX0BPC7_9PSEU|nr:MULTISPECIES: UDP-glucose/GDP-mannose dehydrogenase family protein [Amycolatopsis]MYW90225.1 nucleotide sugar dehydrogenase [Amycolatopsis rubida]NEC55202.1 UDP-glucose/GDP-mannose dehydrogenase family protein [Amycolatopsis rubida]OAP20091.1 UDP-glucose 6-dehydrogenase TuaD [Amycolatopsis sp. M39]
MAERIGVLGAGYVGLTTAACFAAMGHQVSAVDIDRAKVSRLRAGKVDLAEPGLAELVAEGLRERTLAFSGDFAAVAGSTMVFLCLPTPPGEDGTPDLRALRSALGDLGRALAPGTVVVTKSTVPVGTAQRIPEYLGRADLPVVSNPEFLREGRVVDDFRCPDRVVIGADPPDSPAADRVARLYRPTKARVVRTSSASAELAKYASNGFLAVKASYANTLAELCEQCGADVRDVSGVMGLDPRIGPHFLAPGPGWGGSCLPKDASALLRAADSAGVEFGLLRDAVRVNARQRTRMVRAIRTAATGRRDGSLDGVRIGVLGLAFKAGTGDVRDSPAVAVAAELVRHGAEVTAYDPAVQSEMDGGIVVDDPYLVAKDAAALAVLTEWPEFRDLDWRRLAEAAGRPVVVDTRNVLDPTVLAEAGFARIGVGIPMEVSDACSRSWLHPQAVAGPLQQRPDRPAAARSVRRKEGDRRTGPGGRP